MLFRILFALGFIGCLFAAIGCGKSDCCDKKCCPCTTCCDKQ